MWASYNSELDGFLKRRRRRCLSYVYLVAKGIKMTPNLPCSPILAPPAFFLVLKVKSELASAM
jgi:hypothetical protein